jgi:hypothetical protein
MTDADAAPGPPITLAFLGYADRGGSARAAAYEDAVLPLLAEHGAEVVFRGRQDGDDPDLPAEVQILRIPSQAALDAYLADERRRALQVEHGTVFERTTLLRVVPVADPSGPGSPPSS